MGALQRRSAAGSVLAVVMLVVGLVSFVGARAITSHLSSNATVAGTGPVTVGGHVAPSPIPTGPAALANACTALPTGIVPDYLHVTAVSSAPSRPDPRTGVEAPSVSASVAASPLDRTEPYLVVVAISPAGASPQRARTHPIDRTGTVQLWLSSDGSARHKQIRTFTRGTWTTTPVGDADALSYVVNDRSLTLYWTGFHTGDRFGVIVASTTGCAATGLNAASAPNQSIS